MAVDCIVSIVGKIGEYLAAPIGRQLGYLLCYKSNIEDFRSQVENLGIIRDGVQGLVAAAERNGEVIVPEVEAWLASVDKITEESREFSDDVLKESERCFNRHCPNLKLRYQRSRKAKKQTAAADDLKQRRSQFHEIAYRAPPVAMGSTSTEAAEAFESRTSTTKEIMTALRDDQINMIGIHGIGGVGKTTLVKEVGKQAAEDANLFDEIVMAVVSQPPDVKKIQGEIADMLGLTFKEETVSGRAGRLSEILKKKKKILVILDDLWDRVKLETIGIPFGAQHKGCKILLTSRSEDICNSMDTQKNFPVGPLPKQEAWNLFRKMAGDSVDSLGLQPLAVEVAEECAGLPLAIVTVARALKNKGLCDWRDTANRLRKSDIDKRVFESLKLSYNYLESEEVQSFFLLCCLYPEDYDIQIEDLLRYGMGWGLFEDVDTVEGATVRAHKWASDLKSSCLLLDGVDNEFVKMHDVVRDVAIKIASEGKHVFLVRAGLGGTPLPKRDAFNRYTAISIMSDSINELPDGLECRQVEILLLGRRHYTSLQFPDNFFLGMKSLKVLSMTGNLSLPPSLRCLENLQTLCLRCDSLTDLSVIGELRKLEILSISGDALEELPKEIGMLTQLRVLDLEGCYHLRVIPPDVIRGLSQLEELYIYTRASNASLGPRELKHLRRLTTLQINVSDANCLPEDLLFEKLSRFKIFIGTRFEPAELFIRFFGDNSRDDFSSYSKSLTLSLSSPLEVGVKVLMKEAEYLYLFDMKGLTNVLYDLDTQGFRNLKSLIVIYCAKMEYILDAMEPARTEGICQGQLQELRLYELPGLISICKDPAQHVCLRNLRVLKVKYCHGLKNVFSHSMAKHLSKLVEVEVTSCQIMEEIFGNEREAATEAEAMDSIVFPHLHSLKLEDLPKLRNFRSKKKLLDTIGNTEEPLFDNKVSFPSLEILDLDGMTELKEIWDKQLQLPTTVERHALTVTLSRLRELKLIRLPELTHVYPRHGTHLTFQNLCSLQIWCCNSIRHIFSSSIARGLVQLQNLDLSSCEMLEEIIAEQGEGEEDETINSKIIAFPQLRNLQLEDLPNLETFSRESYILDTASLVELRIEGCDKIKAFDAFGGLVTQKLEINDAGLEEKECDLSLFNEKVAFTNLEILVISRIENLQEIFHNQLAAESFYQLRYLEVTGCHKLSKIASSNLLSRLENLERLIVRECNSMEMIFELDGVVGEGQAATSLFQRLKFLELNNLPNLRIFSLGDYNFTLPSFGSVCLVDCPKMQTFSYEFISTPELHGVTVDHEFERPLWKGDLNSIVQHLFQEKVEEGERERVNKSEEAGKVEGKVERGETSSSQAIQLEILELEEEA